MFIKEEICYKNKFAKLQSSVQQKVKSKKINEYMIKSTSRYTTAQDFDCTMEFNFLDIYGIDEL